MYCKKCGMEVSKDDKFCPTCGNDLTKEEKETDPFEKYDTKEEAKTEVVTNDSNKVVYKVFAIIGYVVGIVSLCLVWVPFIFYGSIPGIVLAKLGERNEAKNREAKKGFVMCIVATAINVVLTIVFFIVIAIIAKETGEDIYFHFAD